MNNKLLFLVKGELLRLHKYKVTTVSLIVAVMWTILLYFIDDTNLLSSMLPLVILIDVTMMSLLYVGAMMFFEKTEHTISTMLVTPVSNSDLILSKVIANTIQMFLSSMLIILIFFFVKNIEVKWFFIILALILSISFHSLLGFLFSFYSKDFTSMLVGVMGYTLIFSLPPILNLFNIFFKGEIWGYILLILPSQAAIKLIEVGFGSPIEIKFYISLGVLFLGGFFLFKFIILSKFKDYAVKQSGV